ncbi:tail fiber protein [Aquabacter spiritensis]|nr:tail fiber protein [Aquabacter spiritensis]
MGSIRSFAGNFAAGGTAFAEGQSLSINQNTALFSLLGTTYGGNGRTTFQLPDLNGRLMVGVGDDTAAGEAFGSSAVTIVRANLPTALGGADVPFSNDQLSLGVSFVIGAGGSTVGQIVPFLSNFTPTGYLATDGATLSVAEFPELFAAIGNQFGGDGISTFMLPDLRDKTIIGAGQGAVNYAVGTVIGSDTVTITGNSLTDVLAASFDNHQPSMALNFIVATEGVYPNSDSSVPDDMPFLGEIRAFAGNTIPNGWALADGSTLQISSNEALFAILGTTYGGDGVTTFQLPNLIGRAMTEADGALGAEDGTSTFQLTNSDLPANALPTGAVTVSGTAAEDAVLTATGTVADADGVPASAGYQWQRQDGTNWVDITGATGASYTLTQAEVGHPVRAVLRYTDGQGTSETVASAATAPIANVNDAPTGTVTVSGTAAEDAVLTATSTVADADGFPGAVSYQWQRQIGFFWLNIADATGTAYTLTSAEVGYKVRAVLLYTDGQGTAERVASAATATIANVNDAPTGAVTVSGTAAEDAVLTATSTVADADGVPASAGYQWQRQDGTNWVDIAGATGASYTLTQDDVGHAVRAELRYTDGQGTAESVASAATATIANVNDPPTGAVTVSGTAAEDAVLTATSTVADADGVPASAGYQWQRQDGTNWVDITGATGASYTLTQDDVGHPVRAVLRYTDGQGTAERVASAATAPIANVNDAPTGAVTVSGTAAEDAVLTATSTVADADGVPASAGYQWQRQDGTNWVDIIGATGTSYTLTQAEVGHPVRAVLRYTDGQGTPESVASAATAPVANVNDAPTGTVTVSGTAAEDAVLTATSTVADADGVPASAGYQWQRQDGAVWVDIIGATGTTYTLSQAEVGHRVRAELRYTDGQGTAESIASAATATIANVNDAPTGTVRVSGAAAEDAVLTASHAVADADGIAGAVSYQWQRQDGAVWVDIAGATYTSYTLTQAEVGHRVRAELRYTDGQGTAESIASAATATIANVNDAPTGAVTVSGTAAEDAVLTATGTVADADGVPGAVSYQWQRQDGATWVDITGAIGTSYTLTQAEVGHRVRAELRYTDGQGTAESVTSAPTATIANVNDAPTGTVTVSGAAAEDAVLTASHAVADADGFPASAGYQWQRQDGTNWVDITGATGASYTLTQDDVGHPVRAVLRYTDGQGTAERVASAATAPIANVNDAPTGTVTVSGTAAEDAVLTATGTVADADGVPASVGYQWQRQDGTNWVDITGATGASYTLTQAEVGHPVRAELRYTDGQGTAESVASAATAPVSNVNDAPTGTVTVSGTAAEDAVLTASHTVADADGFPASVDYQWQRQDGTNWVDIAGATGTSYTLTQDDVGHAVRAELRYTDGQGTAESVASAATAPVSNVNDAPTGTVTVSGTAAEDAVLTATGTVADADGVPASAGYQWQRQDGTGWVDITGATGTSYTLAQAEVGHPVRAVLRYTDGQGTVETVASAATAPVANVNDAPTGTVTVSGTAAEDAVLTASHMVADADGFPASVGYQWQRQDGAVWVDIIGATGTTYTLSQAEVGHRVRAELRYTDGQGAVETVASAPTAPIANVNDAPTGMVTVSGTASEDAVLTASHMVADADGFPASVDYQWQRQDGAVWVDIIGATGTTYTLTQAEVGHRVRAELRYTDGQGAVESVASAATAPIAASLPPNSAPSAQDDAFVAIRGEATLLNLLANDRDPEGAALTITQVEGQAISVDSPVTVATGTVTLLADGRLSFTPAAGVEGLVVFTYTVSDGALTASATVSVTVTPPAAAPTPEDDTFTTAAGEAVIIDVLANDADGDVPSDWRVVRVDGGAIASGLSLAVEGGAVTLTEAGLLRFTPKPGYDGPVRFTYTVSDGTGGIATAVVTGTVLGPTGENASPLAHSDVLPLHADGRPVALDVLANDSDPEGAPLRVTAIDGHAITVGGAVGVDGGRVTLSTDGTLLFTPDEGQPGSVTFSYTVADPAGGTASALVTSSAVLADLMPRIETALETHGNAVRDPAALLPVISVIFPGALVGSGNTDGPGGGYVPPAGYGFDESSLLTGTKGLLDKLVTVALGFDTDGTDLVTDLGSGQLTSTTAQSLAIQTISGAGRTIVFEAGGSATSFASDTAGAHAWSRAFAQSVLQPDFDPASVVAFDRGGQGAAFQSDMASGAPLAVKIDGQEADTPHIALSSPFGLADFIAVDGGSAVEVARLVTTARTLGGADDQQAIIRMRQNGMQDVELMFYKVDDYSGTVDGLRPGDAGYDAASRVHAYQTDAGATSISGAGYGRYGEARLAGVDDGDLIAMRITSGGHDFYMFANANETVDGQGINHVWNYGLNTWGWEDVYGGGDRDFNDLVVQMDFVSAALPDTFL